MDTTACDLFRRCLTRRHPDDWHEFLGRYQRRLRTVIWRVLKRQGVERAKQDLDEYAQELYLRLWIVDGRSFNGRSEAELWKYLARAVRNLAVDRRRGAETARRCRERLEDRGEPPGPVRPACPERRAMARQDLRIVLQRFRWAAARDSRPELKMRILRLAYLDGCSSPEIARRLHGLLTPVQVDATIFRLRRRLAEEGLALGRRRVRAAVAG